MTLVTQYEAAIARGDIVNDPLQREVLVPMQNIIDELLQANSSWIQRLFNRSIKGLYLYGPVGVGKTYLVDMFYENVSEAKKARFHFHHFMQQIDTQLRKWQGQKDPLRHIAKNIAQSARVLCFDEFLVHDVAYAMILAKLIPELLAQGVILVISSNTQPDDLYLNGVQRARFLPAIELINKNCIVLHLNEPIDYRLGRQHLIEAYLYPLNDATRLTMEQQFGQEAKEAEENGVIQVQSRDIFFLKRSARMIWFTFDIICNLPRSQLDYLELADRFDTIFVSDVPVLTEKHTTQTIMFIHFIDVMYDRGIKIIISAMVPTAQLYVKGEMIDTFKRTLSRLEEMQSVDYLSRHPHRKSQEFI